MKLLRGKDSVGLFNEKTGEIRVKNKIYTVPPNKVLSTGDVVSVRGNEYDVMEYNPSWFPDVARRGAQLIQPKDAAYIAVRAGIRSGSRVLESGMGSGALSSLLLYILGETGRLYSVEIDESSVGLSEENVRRFDSNSNWEIIKGDVKKSELPSDLDCVILDMPDPWDAVENVTKSLRPGGYLVTYSPTFNQTEKTVIELKSSDIAVIETVEISMRNILVRDGATRPDHVAIAHTAFITFAVKRTGHAINL